MRISSLEQLLFKWSNAHERQTDRQTHRHTDRHTDRQTETEAETQTETETQRQTDRELIISPTLNSQTQCNHRR